MSEAEKELEILTNHLHAARHICENVVRDAGDSSWFLVKVRYLKMIDDALTLAEEHVLKEAEHGKQTDVG